jgi:hypothetical protein
MPSKIGENNLQKWPDVKLILLLFIAPISILVAMYVQLSMKVYCLLFPNSVSTAKQIGAIFTTLYLNHQNPSSCTLSSGRDSSGKPTAA